MLRRLGDSEGDDELGDYLQVWFQGTFGAGLRDDELLIAAPTSFSKEYVEQRFMGALLGHVREVLSPAATLRLVVCATTEHRS